MSFFFIGRYPYFYWTGFSLKISVRGVGEGSAIVESKRLARSANGGTGGSGLNGSEARDELVQADSNRKCLL